MSVKRPWRELLVWSSSWLQARLISTINKFAAQTDFHERFMEAIPFGIILLHLDQLSSARCWLRSRDISRLCSNFIGSRKVASMLFISRLAASWSFCGAEQLKRVLGELAAHFTLRTNRWRNLCCGNGAFLMTEIDHQFRIRYLYFPSRRSCKNDEHDSCYLMFPRHEYEIER